MYWIKEIILIKNIINFNLHYFFIYLNSKLKIIFRIRVYDGIAAEIQTN